MAFNLLQGRVLVQLDAGKKDTGTITESDLPGYLGLRVPQPAPSEGDPVPNAQSYNHVVFAPEMTTEVDIDGVTYIAMHRSAILGYLD